MFKRVIEAALPMTTSHDALRGHLRTALMKAHDVTSVWDSNGPWVNDVFPEHVVYNHQGQAYRRSYTTTQGAAGTDPTVSLGAAKKVHVAYVDTKDNTEESISTMTYDHESVVTTLMVSESALFCDTPQDIVDALVAGAKEAATSGKPTTIPIKVIGPGWGSMAHYSKEMIQESGPQVFTKGTHMYWNHPTATEESERPEGDLSDLAAVFTENSQWNDNGPKGPGLYAKVKVFSDFSTQVNEKGAHIGVSINSPIKFHEGEAEGRHGRIAEKFIKTPLTSADFVTRAGAKGAPIVPVQEADRRSQITKETTMTPEEIKEQTDLKAKVAALEADNAKLKEGQNVTLAVATVSAVLKEAGFEVNDKVITRLCANPEMKDGKVSEAWVKSIVEDLTSGSVGQVKGLGHGREAVDTKAVTEAETKELETALAELGVPKDGLKYAVAGGR